MKTIFASDLVIQKCASFEDPDLSNSRVRIRFLNPFRYKKKQLSSFLINKVLTNSVWFVTNIVKTLLSIKSLVKGSNPDLFWIWPKNKALIRISNTDLHTPFLKTIPFTPPKECIDTVPQIWNITDPLLDEGTTYTTKNVVISDLSVTSLHVLISSCSPPPSLYTVRKFNWGRELLRSMWRNVRSFPFMWRNFTSQRVLP